MKLKNPFRKKTKPNPNTVKVFQMDATPTDDGKNVQVHYEVNNKVEKVFVYQSLMTFIKKIEPEVMERINAEKKKQVHIFGEAALNMEIQKRRVVQSLDKNARSDH